ncbi:UNVERIFIED_CONTAM: hypothetical protein ABID98_001938 [Brevibacillus sp. OAP136]
MGGVKVVHASEEMKVQSIPWQRLTTAYGRGTQLPRLINEEEYGEIANLIEHQGTLWQVTPWALLFLLKKLKQKDAQIVQPEEIVLYGAVADALADHGCEQAAHVEEMAALLAERYLWPVSEEEDEEQWEEGEPRGYEEEAFSSYYYYSHQLLKAAVPTFERISRENRGLADKISVLLDRMK